MKPIEDVLYDLVFPIVEEQKSLSVQRSPSLDENEIVLTIFAESDDIARLIGRQGFMAQAIRQTMSIGSRIMDRRLNIKFESY